MRTYSLLSTFWKVNNIWQWNFRLLLLKNVSHVQIYILLYNNKTNSLSKSFFSSSENPKAMSVWQESRGYKMGIIKSTYILRSTLYGKLVGSSRSFVCFHPTYWPTKGHVERSSSGSALSVVWRTGSVHRQSNPSKFFFVLQSFCCRLSVVLLSYDSRSTLIWLNQSKKKNLVE